MPQPPQVCLRCVALSEDAKKHAKHPEHAGMIHQVAKVARPKPRPRKTRKEVGDDG